MGSDLHIVLDDNVTFGLLGLLANRLTEPAGFHLDH
jgi:hypothetical protein